MLHYGVKGMKWGQHIFGDKPKSTGYRRALGKLRASAKKSKTQRAITKQQKQQDKFNKAIEKAQLRIQKKENLYRLNQLKSIQKSERKQQRAERKIDRIAARQERKNERDQIRYAKNEVKMGKYLEQARKGKLKYGKLSDEQVRQITDRLGMERSARNLGSAEKTWRQQKKEAFRKGKLSGIERGTAASMEEIARAGTIYGIQNFMNRRKRNALAKQQGKENRLRNRYQNKKTHADIAEEIKNEGYETRIREGEGVIKRNVFGAKTAAGQAKYIKKVKSADKKLEEQRKLQDSNRKLLDDVFKARAIKVGGKTADVYKEVYGKDMPLFESPKEKGSVRVRITPVKKLVNKTNPVTSIQKRIEEESRKRYRGNNPLKG